MEEFISVYEQLLSRTAAYINQEYFQLPIDGMEDPVYRERVYCYELYHQLRVFWPKNSIFTLSGEVDKSGHPLFRDNPLLNTKPDLLIHQPGNMEGNLIVIEVKPVNAKVKGIKKDLETLTAFCKLANYHLAIYLIYGKEEILFRQFIKKIIGLSNREITIDLDLIKVYWHPYPNEPAQLINLYE